MKVIAPPTNWYYQKLSNRKCVRHSLSIGLSNYYWSSSQNSANNAWYANFNNGYMNNNNVNNNNYVRLSASFIIININPLINCTKLYNPEKAFYKD